MKLLRCLKISLNDNSNAGNVNYEYDNGSNQSKSMKNIPLVVVT